MKTRFTSIFAILTLALLAVVPALAAPSDTLPAAQTKVLTQTQAVKAPAVLTLTPAVAAAKVIVPVTVKAGTPLTSSSQPRVKRSSDYRFSNPTRWNSDVTCNSIRNQ